MACLDVSRFECRDWKLYKDDFKGGLVLKNDGILWLWSSLIMKIIMQNEQIVLISTRNGE
jgi:hypothetical protein